MQCDKTTSHMVTAGRSYFCTLRNACVTAGKIYHGCFEMLSWPHRTSANIINICFWLLETCTKCSCFIDRGKHKTRRSTVGIWSEVRVYRTPATNIPWGGGLRLGKFPDNRRSMCYTAVQRKSKLCRTKPSTGPQVGIADLVISLSTVY